MKKMLIPIAIAACLLIIGICFLIVGLAVNDWKLSDPFYYGERKTETLEGSYSSLDIDCELISVEILPAEDGVTKVDYPVHSKIVVSCSIENGKLTVDQQFLPHVSFWFHSPKIKIYVAGTPSVDVTTDTGAISLHDLTLSDCELSADTGAVHMENCEVDRLTLEAKTGAARIEEVRARTISCTTKTGAQKLTAISANTVKLIAQTGSIHAKKLEASYITAEASTGSVNLEILGRKEEYTVWVDVDMGSKNISNQHGTTDKTLNLKADTGSVHVTFDD